MKRWKNIPQNEVAIADKEVISSKISLNGQLTELLKLRHQEYLNWNNPADADVSKTKQKIMHPKNQVRTDQSKKTNQSNQ